VCASIFIMARGRAGYTVVRDARCIQVYTAAAAAAPLSLSL